MKRKTRQKMINIITIILIIMVTASLLVSLI